jgi:hypothetical protein
MRHASPETWRDDGPAPAPRSPDRTARGLAAWLVVFDHIRLSLTALLPGPVIAVLAKGYLAVDLFFMLSGFVLWLTYGERLARRDAAAIGNFWLAPHCAHLAGRMRPAPTGFIALSASPAPHREQKTGPSDPFAEAPAPHRA